MFLLKGKGVRLKSRGFLLNIKVFGPSRDLVCGAHASMAAQNGLSNVDADNAAITIKCSNLGAIEIATFKVDRNATVGQFVSRLKDILELKDSTWFRKRKMVIGEAQSSFDHDSLYFRIMQTKTVRDLVKTVTEQPIDCLILELHGEADEEPLLKRHRSLSPGEVV